MVMTRPLSQRESNKCTHVVPTGFHLALFSPTLTSILCRGNGVAHNGLCFVHKLTVKTVTHRHSDRPNPF